MNGQSHSHPKANTGEGLAGAPGKCPKTPKRRMPVSRRSQSLSPVVTRSGGNKSPTTPPRRRCQSASYPNDIPEPLKQVLENVSVQDSNLDEREIAVPPRDMNKMLRALTYKKREFIKMRRSLISDQNALITAYATVRELESRTNTPHDEALGDVRIVSCTSWPAHDLLLLVRDDLTMPVNSEINSVFGSQVLHQIYVQLVAMPDEVLAMAEELMARRKDFIEVLRNKRTSALYHVSVDKYTKFFNDFNQETERLKHLVTETVENMKVKTNYVLKLAKIPWFDRDIMKKKTERYQKENMVLLSKLEELQKIGVMNGIEVKESLPPPPQSDNSLLSPTKNTLTTFKERDGKDKFKDKDLYEELCKEKAAREALKGVVSNAEGMLRVARARITTLEKQLKDTKTELFSAKQKHKELEQLYRHRESSLGARSKKLMEVSKTGEMTIEALSLQRDALELRKKSSEVQTEHSLITFLKALSTQMGIPILEVKELQEHAAATEKMAEARDAEHRSRTESLQAKIQEQEKRKKQAEDRVTELEKKVVELEEVIENLRECSNQLFDVERKRCLEMLPSKQNEPTDKETEIWKELQSTRLTLTRTEEELRSCRADKENFLNSLSRIAQNGADNLQNKMAAELLEKERKIIKMQYLIEEQKESEKLMKQNLCRYENQLNSLRLEVKRLRNYDCYEKDVSFSDLQTELMDLHMQVETLNRERTALVTAAASRALMLERHERAADLFSKMVRTRQDIAKILNENTESHLSEFPGAEASRSLSSVCATAADTWSALKAERARVLRLESAVLAQGLQLEREARVRTQLERRRALLEREVMCVQVASASEPTRNISDHHSCA